MEVKIPKFSNDRYYLVEATGEALFSGYKQRPTAIKRAFQSGHGCYDSREDKMIVPIDWAKRLDAVRAGVNARRHDLDKAVEHRDAVEAAAKEAGRL